MNEAELAALVADLDALVPREGAVLRFGHADTGQPSYHGNRLGYLRYGIELLKVADAAPHPGEAWCVRSDLSYFGDPDVDPGQLAIFMRTELPEQLAPPPPPKRSELLLGTILFILFIGGLTLAGALGLGEIWRWLFSR